MNWRAQATRFFRSLGLEVHRFDHLHAPLRRRLMLLEHYGINLIIDVGANAGQYAHLMRRYGYDGRIVSFEPLKSAFEELSSNARDDSRWIPVNLALGDKEGMGVINVAAYDQCSSLLEVTDRFTRVTEGGAKFVSRETIEISTLDAEFDKYYQPGERAFVKIDTQGYEKHVLDGSRNVLERILGFQLELSLVPLYEGETEFAAMVTLLADLGFDLMSLEWTNADQTSGRLLQVDALFFKGES